MAALIDQWKAIKQLACNRIGLVIVPNSTEKILLNYIKREHKSTIKECVQRINDSLMSTGSKFLKNLASNKAKTSSRKLTLSPHVLQYDRYETAAYLAVRFVPAYGAVTNVLGQLKKRLPLFIPRSMVDFGCGPGTAIIAATELFEMDGILAIDSSESMLSIVQEVCQKTGQAKKLECKRYLPISASNQVQSDLVISSFCLSELPNDLNRKLTVAALWQRTSDVLILIDRGTPIGFNIIASARQQILDSCAKDNSPVHVVAPVFIINKCPHELKCPLINNRHEHWCHFSQKIQNNETMGKKSSQEDVKFSFVILQKQKRASDDRSATTSAAEKTSLSPLTALDNESVIPPHDIKGVAVDKPWPVLILPPLKRVKHVTVDLCTPTGTFERTIIAKSHPQPLYPHIRKSYWGDQWPWKLHGESIPRETKLPEVEISRNKELLK